MAKIRIIEMTKSMNTASTSRLPVLKSNCAAFRGQLTAVKNYRHLVFNSATMIAAVYAIIERCYTKGKRISIAAFLSFSQATPAVLLCFLNVGSSGCVFAVPGALKYTDAGKDLCAFSWQGNYFFHPPFTKFPYLSNKTVFADILKGDFVFCRKKTTGQE